jgi:hypothetical protein
MALKPDVHGKLRITEYGKQRELRPANGRSKLICSVKPPSTFATTTNSAMTSIHDQGEFYRDERILPFPSLRGHSFDMIAAGATMNSVTSWGILPETIGGSKTIFEASLRFPPTLVQEVVFG